MFPGCPARCCSADCTLSVGGANAAPRAAFRCAMQKRGLAVKEFELIRKNFSDTGNFGRSRAGGRCPGCCVLVAWDSQAKPAYPNPLHAGFGIQEHIDLGLKYDPSTGIYGKSRRSGAGRGGGGSGWSQCARRQSRLRVPSSWTLWQDSSSRVHAAPH